MESIGIYEAKSRLSELVEQAEAGKEVTITRHGKPVAKLVAARPGARRDRSALMDEILASSRAVRLKRPFALGTALSWGRR